MNKMLAILACLLLLSVVPADCQEKEQYLAVFDASPDTYSHIRVNEDWAKFNPDLLVESSRFTDFSAFLKTVKDQSQGRPILLDIDCHGSETGYLATTEDGEDECTIGYLLNQIDEQLAGKKVTVCLEACYSAICYSKNLHNKQVVNFRSYHFQPYKNAEPSYPVYGELVNGKSTINYNNLTFLQNHFNLPIYMVDLRHKSSSIIDDGKHADLSLKSLLGILRILS